MTSCLFGQHQVVTPGWLQDPEYVSVHAEAAAPTPLKLQQAYMVCPLQDKVDILWSFIKTHLKASPESQQRVSTGVS